MSNNSLFVWQVRVWMLALAAVLVFANAPHPAADKAHQQLGIADSQACLTAGGTVVRAKLTAAGSAGSARKCREAKLVGDASVPRRPVGG